MNSKEVLEYLKTCKFCKIVMGTDYENDDRYFTLYDVFSEEIEIIQKDLDRLEKENAKLKKVIEDIKNLPDCDICDSNWHKGCMCLQNKFKKALLNNNFKHMFDNCKLTPLPKLPELEELQETYEARETIEKDLKALEIIKEHRFLFVEKGQLYVGRYADTELLLEEDDFQDKHEYELLKEVFENE